MNGIAQTGSGGLGAVSIGVSETFVWALVVLVVAFGLWKLVKMLMLALKG